MRCISLWQPWASLLVLGTKTIETRHWPTSYRGPLLIHAAKRQNQHELFELALNPGFNAAFHPIGGTMQPGSLMMLPFGAIVGQVELVDCKPTSEFGIEIDTHRYAPFDVNGWTERLLGNFEHGRFGWVMANPKVFEDPIPYKGSQGFFEVDLEALKKVAHVG